MCYEANRLTGLLVHHKSMQIYAMTIVVYLNVNKRRQIKITSLKITLAPPTARRNIVSLFFFFI